MFKAEDLSKPLNRHILRDSSRLYSPILYLLHRSLDTSQNQILNKTQFHPIHDYLSNLKGIDRLYRVSELSM